MAINHSNSFSNRHMCFTCASGNGKGIAVQALGLYPKNSCLAIFDPYGEYDRRFGGRQCFQYRTRRGFAKAFASAWGSGKPFVIAYYPQKDKDRIGEMQWFGELMWAASDGNRVLYLLFEEFGKCVTSNSIDDTITGEIATGGRKYGLRSGYVFQRSAEVPKTIWANTRFKIIGAQEFTTDAKRVTEQLGCSADDVAELGRLNEFFAMQHSRIDDEVKTKVHYLVGQGLRDYKRQAVIVPPCRALTRKWSKAQKHAHQQSRFELVN